MREGRIWLRLLLAGLLACTLAMAGCEGDDGDDGVAGVDGEDFQLETAGEFVGVGNCATCHGGSVIGDKYAESAHANQGSHTISSCSQSCHNPRGEGGAVSAAFGINTPNAVACESCHGAGGDHFGVGPIPDPAPDTTVCGECHNGTIADGTAHIEHHPFNAEITARFQSSRHANQHPREAFCSACHSHEGGVQLLAMGGAEDVLDLADKYNSNTVSTWSLVEEELSTKQCATCHDPHTAGLRGEGDVVDSFTWDDDEDPATPDVTEDTVVYSAEFNLCTTCHMVALEATPAGHGDDGLLLSYELSDESYTAANMYDAAAGTYDYVEFEIENADGTTRTREVYATQVHYHDNGSPEIVDGVYEDHNIGRKFAETHFAGTMMGAVAGLDADDPAVGPVDTTITGYNVNAAADDACTVCHDPHTGGKLLSTAEGEHDDPFNTAVSYGEGIGEFHKDYLGDAMGHGCQPCHDGGENFVAWTYGGSVGSSYGVTNTIGCRDCHNLEQANAEPSENNAEAFQQVREFDAGHEFAFNSGVVVDASELGVNQICFECHKGRTGALTAAEEDALVNEYEDDLDEDDTDETYVGTENRTFSYLHYAPAFSTLFGVDSGMVPTYEGNDYAGRFAHVDITDFSGTMNMGCVDCHNVHDTDGNDVAANKMANPDYVCAGCHTGTISPASLQARVEEFSNALLEELLVDYLAADETVNLYPPLQNFIDDLQAAADDATRLEMLAVYLEGRTNVGPSLEAAKAATVWKVFTYEDGAVHGPNGVHGHGGSWAHNSAFARQVMFDALEAIGGNPADYGLTRP